MSISMYIAKYFRYADCAPKQTTRRSFTPPRTRPNQKRRRGCCWNGWCRTRYGRTRYGMAKSFHVRTHGHTPNHSSLLDPHATHPAAHSSRCAHSSSFSVLLLFSSSLSFLSHSLKALIHLKCHLLLFPFSCTIIQLYRANNAILPT